MSARATCARCGRQKAHLVWSKFSRRHYCADFAACDNYVARTKRQILAERAW
jgi:hypothetical protein